MHEVGIGERLVGFDDELRGGHVSESDTEIDDTDVELDVGVEEFERLLDQETKRSGGSLSSLRIMYNTANSFKLLTPDEEVSLAKKIEEGDLGAKEAFVNANLRLSIYFGRRFVGRGVPLIDIVQEANIGLIRAVEKFDWRRGVKFSSYADLWIQQQIRRALPKCVTTIAISEEAYSRYEKFMATENRLANELQRPPSVEEVAREMGIMVAQAQHAINAHFISGTLSFDVPVYGDDGQDSLTILDLLGSDPDTVIDQVESNRDIEVLREALTYLTPEEYGIIRHMYGLKGFEQLNQSRAAERLGLSQSVIKRRQAKVIELLRGYIEVLR